MGLPFGRSSGVSPADWFLNYRSGAFLLPSDAETARDAATGRGGRAARRRAAGAVRGSLAGGNMDAVPLEKPPKVAVYAPPNAPPWDDAVTMALNYAGIEFEKVWTPEVLGQKLKTYDWLHLHHEDFTGQYSKFFLNYAGRPGWWIWSSAIGPWPGHWDFPRSPPRSSAVALAIADFVETGWLSVRHVHRHGNPRLGPRGRWRGHRRILRRWQIPWIPMRRQR